MKCEDCAKYSETDACGGFNCSDHGFNYFQPKEKEMEKQKFAIDEAKQFIKDMNIDSNGTGQAFLYGMDKQGYIRKSELQTLVEDLEKMTTVWHESAHDLNDWDTRFIVKLLQTIQALKKSHLEFKE